MTPPTRFEIMDNLHIDYELADCLLNCTKGDSNQWMDRLGLRRDNLPSTSIPTFESPVLKSLNASTRKVVHRLAETYHCPSALKTAVADPGFVAKYTGPIVARFAAQVWGESESPEERLSHTALSWDNEDDKENDRIQIYLTCWMVHRAHQKIRKMRSADRTKKRAPNSDVGVNTKRRKMATGRSDGANGTLGVTLLRCDNGGDQPSIDSDSDRSESGSTTAIAGERIEEAAFDGPRRDHSPRPPLFSPRSDGRRQVRPTHREKHTCPPSPSHSSAVPRRKPELHSLHSPGDETLCTHGGEDGIRRANFRLDTSQRRLPRVSSRRSELTSDSGGGSNNVYSVPPSPSELVVEEPAVTEQTSALNANTIGTLPIDADEALTPSTTHGLSSTPLPDANRRVLSRVTSNEREVGLKLTCGSVFPDVSLSRSATEDCDTSIAASGNDLQSTPVPAPVESTERDSLQKELLHELHLSCFVPESLETAEYRYLLDLVSQLRGKEASRIGGIFDSNVVFAEQALDVWVRMVQNVSALRRETGFYGERDSWTAFCTTLDRSERLAATKRFSEMQCFMAKLKRQHPGLDAGTLGKSVAPHLWDMVGAPDYVPLEHMTDYLCAFCAGLFVWFG
ncbi:hypothetical protein K458DRAFT_429609 [Lentithecium fluviatile CBS 122367]|uniref:Uncharacterized protein n=1 Tax=Lentithecium fluviatile CBS 122367 TaxID=1168545 RepID=A0A6G1J7Y3_9PLEO|nr:hypothetical protein K458DRAFT_429609 [Lentithecium fluviatile CBS 122367]